MTYDFTVTGATAEEVRNAAWDVFHRLAPSVETDGVVGGLPAFEMRIHLAPLMYDGSGTPGIWEGRVTGHFILKTKGAG